MFSVAVVEPDRVEIVEIPDPQPGPYEAVIKNEVRPVLECDDQILCYYLPVNRQAVI